MDLECYSIIKKLNVLISPNDPRNEYWKRKWMQPVNLRAYDSIEMTKSDLSVLTQSMDAEKFTGSELLINPSLSEFVLRYLNEETNRYTVILFKKSFMPERLTSSKDGIVVSKPIIDAYVYFNDGTQLDLIMNFGIVTISSRDDYTKMTYEYPIWALNPDIFETESLLEYARGIKYTYLFIQQALYERPTVFEQVSVTRQPVNHSSSTKKRTKKRNKIKAVKVIKVQPEELRAYVKGHREITCPCWGVIGHWRTYKSGKKVWIAPYRKGKERNNASAYVPKEYDLQKEES